MTLRDLNERRRALINARFPPGQEYADSLDFDLDVKEYAALGYAVAQWAYMEDALLKATEGIAEAIEKPFPAEARSDAFRPRLRAFYDLIQLIPSPDAKKLYLDLHARITTENGLRQILTHGLWSFDASDPKVLIVDKPSAAGGSFKLLNQNGIVDFAIRVSRISLQLLYPNGLKYDDIVELRDGRPALSRQFLLAVMPNEDAKK